MSQIIPDNIKNEMVIDEVNYFNKKELDEWIGFILLDTTIIDTFKLN